MQKFVLKNHTLLIIIRIFAPYKGSESVLVRIGSGQRKLVLPYHHIDTYSPKTSSGQGKETNKKTE